MIQYQDGMVDYQRVLDSQRSQSQAQNRLTEVQGSVARNFIALYKTLGGGWQIREGIGIRQMQCHLINPLKNPQQP